MARVSPFLESLEKVIEGEVAPESVLLPFIRGLSQFLADFETSLEHQPDELIEALGGYLDAIAEGVEQCEILAKECLRGNPAQEDYDDLVIAHSHLEQLLLDFHRESWILKGPTSIDWVNMVIAGAEAFLKGGALPSHLQFLLEEHIEELQLRRMTEDAPNLEPFLNLCRRLSRWTGGHENPTRSELEELLARFRSHTELMEGYLAARKVSLEQVVSLLGEELEPEELEHLVLSALDELDKLRLELTRFERAGFSVRAEEAVIGMGDILGQVDDLLGRFLATEESPNWDHNLQELYDAYEELEEATKQFRSTMDSEGMVDCPSCGEKNSRGAKRCGACTAILPASVGEISSLDLTEGQDRREEQNVLRFRRAVREFQNDLIPLDNFRQELAHQNSLLARTRQGFQKNQAEGDLPQQGRHFLRSLDRLDEIFGSLSQIELSNDTALEELLTAYEEQVRLLRELKAQLD